MRLIRGTRGQSTAEYAIVISVVIGAAIAMTTYVRRGLNAKIKAAADGLSNFSAAPVFVGSADVKKGFLQEKYTDSTVQYAPYYFTEQGVDTVTSSAVTQTFGANGEITGRTSTGVGRGFEQEQRRTAGTETELGSTGTPEDYTGGWTERAGQ